MAEFVQNVHSLNKIAIAIQHSKYLNTTELLSPIHILVNVVGLQLIHSLITD